MRFLIAKDLSLFREIFFMGEMSKFLAVRQDFSPSPGLPIKVQGKRWQSTPDGCNNFLTLLVRNEIPGV